MINLISFPDFGCGGLFCTLFNDQEISWSKNFPGTVKNFEHDALKLGANYMNGWQFSHTDWNATIQQCEKKYPSRYCGTHIPLKNLPKLSGVGKVVQICTENLSSRLILWLRAHHLIYLPKHSINNIIKQKEFSKDFTTMIIKPFDGAINIELSNYIYDKKYRENIHEEYDLKFNQVTFKEWISANKYIFNLQKSNIAFRVFYENIQNTIS